MYAKASANAGRLCAQMLPSYTSAGQAPPLEVCDRDVNDCDGVDDNGFDTTSDPR